MTKGRPFEFLHDHQIIPITWSSRYKLNDSMSEVSTYFVDHCKTLVESLSAEDYNSIVNETNDTRRILLLYDRAQKIPIQMETDTKCSIAASNRKLDGNEEYANKDFKTAIQSYTDALIMCPFDTAENRTLYSIILANRSTAYMACKKYSQCLFDIDHVVDLTVYPEHLLYKIWLRKARCHFNLNDAESEIVLAYEKAKACLQAAQVDQNFLKYAVTCIENGIRDAATLLPNVPSYPPEENNFGFNGRVKFPALSTKLDVFIDDANGRHIVAVEEIAAGEIIAMEPAHCSVLNNVYALIYCEHCKTKCSNVLPCYGCINVAFCSVKCRSDAHNYHKYECKILGTLRKSGASVNCIMALRTITQKDLNYLTTTAQVPEEYRDPLQSDLYEYSNYETIAKLCKNLMYRQNIELIHYSFMAIFLLRLLKCTNYFGEGASDMVLTDDESIICRLIYAHLQSFEFNAHEIAEVRHIPPKELTKLAFHVGAKPTFNMKSIGAGVYPTLALFNHSCDPSVVRYNRDDKLILQAIKSILPGDQVFDNYGPNYAQNEFEERQNLLFERYKFRCVCIPCVEQWPTFAGMDSNMLQMPCNKCGNGYWFHKDAECPEFICPVPTCGHYNNILLNLLALTGVTPHCTDAEILYNEGDYRGALLIYAQALQIYNKNLLPPCMDIVKMQQRMRNCMANLGNVTKEV